MNTSSSLTLQPVSTGGRVNTSSSLTLQPVSTGGKAFITSSLNLQVAMDLVNKSDDGVLYFTVDGEKVHVDGVVPIMPPLYLSIQRDMSIIQPQVEATFALTQLLV